MSTLTKKLECIWSWLESTNLEFFDCYNPGLTRQQVDRIIKDFPFKLSEEVYELYQWRNGTANPAYENNYCLDSFLFPEQLRSDINCSFCSLQDSIYVYTTGREANNYDDEYWNKKWFPIAAFETKRMLYVVGDIDPSPVYLWGAELIDNPRVYKDITSMISVIAECCELGLYQVIPKEYVKDKMMIRIDETKLDLEKEIYQKYNS
jgi:cell wall assembly regulator SMI1